ncbi:gamma-glutamylcyclotransferase family protein [Actinomycetospora atypica]|uniref:Gamma-glutamylcyclotransferase n=1 Tax=Actinomycetospora atypica TaxID=1290095 RepID=A0ABV9YNQ1_9PSEU
MPDYSFVHDDAATRRLLPDEEAGGGWRVDGFSIDAWLARRGAVPLAGRVPVLAYGSNACPSKITWLRTELGLPDPVVALRVAVRGVAAVWAAGRRARDDARPATLSVSTAAMLTLDVTIGARTTVPEQHHVWLATPEQVAVLDRCEGRGERYDLARLDAATVHDERGVRLDPVLGYWPAAPLRAPLLVDGAPVRLTDLGQAAARDLVGEPAAVPPGAATPLPGRGCADPRSWPDRVFVYGTLQPGASAWWRLAPHATGSRPAVATGRVYDTGYGYPALVRGAGTVPGHLVTLADPAAAMPALDAYEGPDYRRERVVVYREENTAERRGDGSATAASTGELAWAWIWGSPPSAAWSRVTGSWAGS